MAYDKTVWVDHIENPETGEVILEGTPINAKNLNNIEAGIVEAFNTIKSIDVKEDIETVINERVNSDLNKPLDKVVEAYINTLKQGAIPIVKSFQWGVLDMIQPDKTITINHLDVDLAKSLVIINGGMKQGSTNIPLWIQSRTSQSIVISRGPTLYDAAVSWQLIEFY